MQRNKAIIKTINLFLIIAIFIVMFKFNILLGSILLLAYVIFKLSLNKDFLYSFKGNKAFKIGDYKNAIKFNKKAALYEGSKLRYINTYVYLEMLYGSTKEALHTIDKIKSNRKFDNASYNEFMMTYALLNWKIGNLDYSLETLQNIYDSGFHTLELFQNFGYILINSGDLSKAMAVNLEGLELDNLNEILRANLGEIYFKSNEPTKALDVFENLVKENVQFMEPYYYLSLLLKNTNPEKAKGLLQEALFLKESILSNLSKKDLENLLKTFS